MCGKVEGFHLVCVCVHMLREMIHDQLSKVTIVLSKYSLDTLVV